MLSVTDTVGSSAVTLILETYGIPEDKALQVLNLWVEKGQIRPVNAAQVENSPHLWYQCEVQLWIHKVDSNKEDFSEGVVAPHPLVQFCEVYPVAAKQFKIQQSQFNFEVLRESLKRAYELLDQIVAPTERMMIRWPFTHSTSSRAHSSSAMHGSTSFER